MERIYEYDGIRLGSLVFEPKYDGNYHYINREFIPERSEYELMDIINEMSPEERIFMRRRAFGVYKLLEYYGLNLNDFISNEDILINAINRDCRNMTELNHKNKRLWKLIKERGLEEELFQDF